VRPTDENQDGSTRPNLLSGGRRRIADDNNILARLERDSVRQALGNRSRAAWHVAAAALVLLLVLFVAWVAYQNTGPEPVAPTPRAPVDMGPASATVINPASPWSMLPSSAPQHASSTTGAVAPPPSPSSEAVHDRSASQLPPLVLLEKPFASAKPSATPQVARVAPVQTARNTNPAPAPAPAPAIKAAAAEPSRAAPSATVTLARASPQPGTKPRPRKLALDEATADTPVDADVALLSAIIIHDSAHASEKAQLDAAGACARTIERRCARKPSANQ
jgi:hypothetical protein